MSLGLVILGTGPDTPGADSLYAGSTKINANFTTLASTAGAIEIGYDNTTSGLVAADVQAAIDEVAAGSGGGATQLSGLSDVYSGLTPSTGDFLVYDVASGGVWDATNSFAYDMAFYISGAMIDSTGSATVGSFIASRAITIPSGATGSVAKSAVASTGTAIYDIKKNGSAAGTITFTSSATGVFAAASPISLAAGDVLTIVNPASLDATIADISVTIIGYAALVMG